MRLLRIALCLVVVAVVPSMARADLLAEIRSRGVLRVGMAEYAPWMTLAPGGKPIGLEVDIVERLAGDLGVRLQVVATPFDGAGRPAGRTRRRHGRVQPVDHARDGR